MPGHQQRPSFHKPNPERDAIWGKLERHVEAIFRPIERCALGPEFSDIKRVRVAFFRKFRDGHLWTDDLQELRDGLAKAFREIQEVDLLTFHPDSFLAGFGIGDAYARRWSHVTEGGQLYPRELVEERIAKAQRAFNNEEWDLVDADYPEDPVEYLDYYRFSSLEFKPFLDEETAWVETILPELRKKYDNFRAAPQRIQKFDRELEGLHKKCHLTLADWQKAQGIEDEAARAEAMNSWAGRCRSLYHNADALHAKATSYFGIPHRNLKR